MRVRVLVAERITAAIERLCSGRPFITVSDYMGVSDRDGKGIPAPE